MTGAADRIVIGRRKLRAKGAGLGTSILRTVVIEATALPEWDYAPVWTTRTVPAPRQALGYVLRAHAERTTEPGRPERLIAAAVEAYRNRPKGR